MKTQNRFKVLFKKYVRNQCTSSELEEFFDLIKQLPEKASVFQDDFIKEEIGTIEKEKLSAYKAEEIFNKISLRKNPSKRKSIFGVYKIAAVFIGLIFSGGLLWLLNNAPNANEFNQNYVIIQKSDGRKEVLRDDQQVPILSKEGDTIGVKNGNRIAYTKENESLVYNTLFVPRGKKIELSLADGSLIYLNSGSSIRYPLSFKSSNKRMIQLSGEAYFQVAEDSLRPFIVNSSDFNVEVLGTSFNFNSYKENESIEVVLVEGLIAMYDNKGQFKGDTTQLLNPGYKGSYSKGAGIDKTLVETNLYTSWMNGNLIYRNKTLKQIFISLERNFDIEIENRNDKLSEETLNANFGSESIEKIMEYLNNVYQFKYTMQDDLIIIE